GYIATLSTQRGYDQNGIPFARVDEELRRRLETKLITKILDFKIA
ncbi:MAG TPA: helix-turn-helix domain-containing protein, partial [Ruminococcaceae bacterium]|nr:helix-turn-helix domain-containing protein [Oscillospiraceae bacterium]